MTPANRSLVRATRADEDRSVLARIRERAAGTHAYRQAPSVADRIRARMGRRTPLDV